MKVLFNQSRPLYKRLFLFVQLFCMNEGFVPSYLIVKVAIELTTFKG